MNTATNIYCLTPNAAENINARRCKLQMTRAELAAAMSTETRMIFPSQIYNWETEGYLNLSTFQAERLCKTLKCWWIDLLKTPDEFKQIPLRVEEDAEPEPVPSVREIPWIEDALPPRYRGSNVKRAFLWAAAYIVALAAAFFCFTVTT